MQHTGIAVVGSGSAVPPTTLTNAHLCQMVDTSEEWIGERTGIHQRHLNDGRSSLTELATKAALEAITMAKLQPMDIDLIILATSTADDMFGSASSIQFALGATRAVAFDLTAACSGFIFGLVTCAQFLQTGTYGTALLIGGDVLSRWVDWSDRRTCILFGDGAGAVVIQSHPVNHLLGFELHSDGSQNKSLSLKYGGTDHELLEGIAVSQGNYKPIDMNGQEVYRFAVRRVPEVLEKTLLRANLTVDDVDWLLLHQANQRIMVAVAERLHIPIHKVISNVARYGNTSAASIPIALDEFVREGKIKTGDVIATSRVWCWANLGKCHFPLGNVSILG